MLLHPASLLSAAASTGTFVLMTARDGSAMAQWFRWEAPRIRGEEEMPLGRATSVDLFYDLVFGAVIALLASTFAENITWAGLLTFVVLFIPAVRLWIGQQIYGDRFEADDVSYRLLIFFSMLAAGGLAVAAPQGLGATFPLFFGSYLVGRIVQTVAWFGASGADPLVSKLAYRYLAFWSAEALLLGVAVFSPPPMRFALLLLTIAIDLVLPLFTTGIQSQIGHFRQEHMTTRFGDFFLLILGQLVLVAVLVMTRTRIPTPADLAAGALAFATGFVLWWTYADHVVGRPLEAGRWRYAVWSYLNIPLFIAVGAFGAGVFSFVAHGEAVVPTPVRLLLTISFGMAVLFAGLAEFALVPLRNEARPHLLRWSFIHGLPAALAVAVGILGQGLTAIPLMLLILATGLICLISGEYYRARPAPEGGVQDV